MLASQIEEYVARVRDFVRWLSMVFAVQSTVCMVVGGHTTEIGSASAGAGTFNEAGNSTRCSLQADDLREAEFD